MVIHAFGRENLFLFMVHRKEEVIKPFMTETVQLGNCCFWQIQAVYPWCICEGKNYCLSPKLSMTRATPSKDLSLPRFCYWKELPSVFPKQNRAWLILSTQPRYPASLLALLSPCCLPWQHQHPERRLLPEVLHTPHALAVPGPSPLRAHDCSRGSDEWMESMGLKCFWLGTREKSPLKRYV